MLFWISEKNDRPGRDRGPDRRTASGFTLMEVLVAVSVFAVLVSIVLGSLRFLLSRSAQIREDVAVYEQARVCLDRIAADLRSVYVSGLPGYEVPDLDDDPDPYRFFCDAAAGETRLMFTAFTHLPLGGGIPARAARILYFLTETENDGRVLIRRDTALETDPAVPEVAGGEPEGTDPVLCRRVKEVRFTCFDDRGDAFEYWDSDSGDVDYATPVAVRVAIEIEGLQASHWFETTVGLPVFREKIESAL